MVSETIIMEEDEASSTGHSALKSANKVHIWANYLVLGILKADFLP